MRATIVYPNFLWLVPSWLSALYFEYFGCSSPEIGFHQLKIA